MADPSLLATLLLALAITIAAKPVFEQKSPLTLPLFKHFNLANHNAVERDRHPVKRSGPGDNPKPKNINAYFKTIEYTVVIRIGNGSANNPNTTCKWLRHLVANEEIPTGFFLQTTFTLTLRGEQAMGISSSGSNDFSQLVHLGWS